MTLLAVIISVTAGFSFTAHELLAAPPKIVSYQGRLTDASGNLLSGSYFVRFSIYTAATAGTKLWPSGTPSSMPVTITNGLFSVGIGDTSAGGDALTLDFESNAAYYLQVEISSDNSTFEALSPRQPLVASQYAINASTVAGATPGTSANNILKLGSLGEINIAGTITTLGRLILGSSMGVGGATALLIDTASGFDGTLLDLSVNGVSKLSVAASGLLTAPNGVAITCTGCITNANVATTLTGKTYNGLTLTAQAVGFTVAGGTTSKTLTVSGDATVSGTNTGDQDLSGLVPKTTTVNGHALSGNISLTATDVGLGSVENTALSTWAGTANLTTLGTIGTGTWNATAIADNKIASALTGKTYNGLTLTSNADGFSAAGGTTSRTLTVTGSDITLTGGGNTLTLTGSSSLNQNLLTTSSPTFAALTLSSPLSFANGGTGLSSLSQGDVLYASAANTLAALAKNTTATRYLANTGTSNNPAWAQVDLTNGVTGTLPVGNGGAGAATFASNGVLYGNGTSAFGVTAQGAANTVLTANAGAPSFSTSPTLTNLTLTGSLLVPDGAIGTPSIGFTADTDSGIYRGAANSVGMTGGGVLLASASLVSTTRIFTVGDGTNSVQMLFNGGAGSVRDFAYQSGSVNRWVLRTDGTAESGSNAGSDFNFIARDDSGASLGAYLFIKRSSGNVGIGNTTGTGKLSVTGHIHTLGTAPATLTAGCGNTASIIGTDTSGFVTINGTGITGACGFTFNTAWTNRPVCIAGFDVATTTNAIKATSTTTTLTMTVSTGNYSAADVLAYHCFGRE